ncbi:hypothetical protein P4233_01700 [Pseudomonas aeruginosa]|nr:hypothetical protein [Pseudomonas aeruginosa]
MRTALLAVRSRQVTDELEVAMDSAIAGRHQRLRLTNQGAYSR